MKKLLFLLLVLGAVRTNAQVTKGSIDLKDSSINRSIPFEVKTATDSVKWKIKVYAVIGKVRIMLTDPNGKRSENITIGTDTRGGGDEPSKGELSDDKKLKIPGIWKFNISAENTTAKISYEIEIIKP